MQKKITIAIVVALLALGGYVGWTMLRWSVVYRMKVDDVMLKKVARFPTTQTVIGLPDLMKEAAVESKVSTETLHTDVMLEGRSQGMVVFWYVVVVVSDGKHDPLRSEQRVESDKALLADAEALEAAGVKIKKP